MPSVFPKFTADELKTMIREGLDKGQFRPYYQPQCDQSTGLIIGAEALARWFHPEYGVVSPGYFVPQMEEDGTVTELDFQILECSCRFLRECLDNNRVMAPVSVNVSRCDLSVAGLAEKIDAVRQKYDVPVKYIHIELTESAAVGSLDEVKSFLADLKKLGYVVEMDDFGSGSSSLNVLKDVDFNIIKLDLNFLSGNLSGGRGGTIVSAVVRMCKWLGIPVIAEGVETPEQADFMRSLGCDYIQGYLYAKPMCEEDYIKVLSQAVIGNITPGMSIISTLDAGAFWSPESQETLIFSNYVGGAAIFEYNGEKTEILRVNQKFVKELGMNMSEKNLVSSDLFAIMDENNRRIFADTLKHAIESGDEQECETWVTVRSECCGEEKLCIRFDVRVIGKSPVSTMFYSMIRNITAEKNRFSALADNERRFKAASEQVNIYYWEYTVATKEMRPCFRCMRDLGLPALVTNYPEPAIEAGIFPPEVADMYRDWHRQIAAGVPSLEAIIPLTVGRVPFRVRYTTEFDETGKPVKAYGSAALVVN